MLFCLFVFSHCKKTNAFNNEDGQSCIDLTFFRTENDAVISDANYAMMDQFLVRGKSSDSEGIEGASNATLCGVAIDTTQVYQGIINLNYNGLACNGKTKTGIVKIALQNYPIKKWKQKGCVLKIEYINYKVSNTLNGKSLQMDGVQYLTNESGGTWYDIRYLNQPNAIYSVSGADLKVRFGKDATAIYSQSRRYTYTYSGNVYTCTMEGTGTQGNISNLESWGQTRDGMAITSEVKVPLVWKSTCGIGEPISGEVIVKVDGKYFDLDCVFGSDENGNYESGGTCAFGWKLNWKLRSRTHHRVFGYKN